MKRRCSGNRSRAGAFTLVELLVAFAISALLMVALVNVISQTVKTSRKSSSSISAYSSAAAALDLLASDLEALAVRGEAFEYLQTVKEDVGGVTDVTRLMLVTLGNTDSFSQADAGQMRAVCYRLLRQDPVKAGGKNLVYGLYRTAVSAAVTFSDYAGVKDLSAPFASATPTVDDYVAGNIVDFQVRFYPAGGGAAANDLNAKTLPVRLSAGNATVGGTKWSGAPLEWCEVSLTVLEDDGVRALDSGALPIAEATTRYGHTLSRRFALRMPITTEL